MVYATIAFGLFAAVTLAFGLGVVLARDVFHAALYSGRCPDERCAGALRDAAGGVYRRHADPRLRGRVLILVTFAVMLTRSDTETEVNSA